MTQIASGGSAVVTVTSNQQIAINSAPGVQCVIEATSGVQGAASKLKLANHKGGFAVYGPFGVGTVTIYAVGGQVDYDAAGAPTSVDDTNVTPAEVRALVSRDWVLSAATSGVASRWVLFEPGQRIAYALDSGTTSTSAAVDFGFDGATSSGQAYTITYASSTEFEISTLLLSPAFVALARAALDAGTFTGYYYRVTVASGGPLSVINNV